MYFAGPDLYTIFPQLYGSPYVAGIASSDDPASASHPTSALSFAAAHRNMPTVSSPPPPDPISLKAPENVAASSERQSASATAPWMRYVKPGGRPNRRTHVGMHATHARKSMSPTRSSPAVTVSFPLSHSGSASHTHPQRQQQQHGQQQHGQQQHGQQQQQLLLHLHHLQPQHRELQPQQDNTNTEPFVFEDGRVEHIPRSKLKQKSKLFIAYFQTLDPSPTDLAAVRRLRRRLQCRDASKVSRLKSKQDHIALLHRFRDMQQSLPDRIIDAIRPTAERLLPHPSHVHELLASARIAVEQLLASQQPVPDPAQGEELPPSDADNDEDSQDEGDDE
jgi:hypothetical protein